MRLSKLQKIEQQQVLNDIQKIIQAQPVNVKKSPSIKESDKSWLDATSSKEEDMRERSIEQ